MQCKAEPTYMKRNQEKMHLVTASFLILIFTRNTGFCSYCISNLFQNHFKYELLEDKYSHRAKMYNTRSQKKPRMKREEQIDTSLIE